MISFERCNKALTYMIETDEGMAMAKSYMTGLDSQTKTVLAREALAADAKSMNEREAIARCSDAYTAHLKAYEQAVYDFEILRNKRTSEAMVIECWRSLNANQRRGNI